MDRYTVSIELNGEQRVVGSLSGQGDQVSFSYSRDFLDSSDAAPISLSLPLREEAFTPHETRCFFEGLLPEGFTRRSVAQWMRVEENDYISILHGLGRECLGAVRIVSEEDVENASYEKLSPEQVKLLAGEGATKSAELVVKAHLSLTGATGKAGLYYDEPNEEWYLPKGDAPSTHIVKQSHVRLNSIVTNEQLALLTAAACGIEMPKSFIINTGSGQDADILLAVERYDRVIDEHSKMLDGLSVPFRLHQEDFAQAMGIPGGSKYERSEEKYLKSMFDILRTRSQNPIADQERLWKAVVFDCLIGNTDSHIKNFSLLYGKNLRSIRLAPIYDIVSTVVYETSTREMAFAIGRERNVEKISRECFREAASDAGISNRIAFRYFDEICGKFEKALSESADRLAEQGYDKATELREKILTNGGCRQLLA